MEAPDDGDSRPKGELVILKKNDNYQLQITPTMAETFHLFPDLPKELRLKIWEQAMIAARPSRRILIYRDRVVPFKQFISPLLLVNYESRTCAKGFYNVKLDIYPVRPVTQDQVKHLDKKTNWDRIKGSQKVVDGKIHNYTDSWVQRGFSERERSIQDRDYGAYERLRDEDLLELEDLKAKYTIDLEDDWSDFVRDELRILGASSIREAEKSGPAAGKFYISPEHDVFITDYDCRLHFSIDSASKVLGADLPNFRCISCRHISEKLSAATCQRVSTLMIVRRYRLWQSESDYDQKHCVFAAHNFVLFNGEKYGSDGEFCLSNSWLSPWCWDYQRTWKKEKFPNVRTHFVLSFAGRYEQTDSFPSKLTGSNDDDFYRLLELWDLDECEYEGVVRRGFAMKKERSFWIGAADWLGDLMSHWDNSK